MWFVRGLLSVLGRTMYGAYFLLLVVGYLIPRFKWVVDELSGRGFPEPHLILYLAIAALVTGGVLVCIGYRARLGASLLLAYLIAAAVFYHNFWTLDPSTPDFTEQRSQFFQTVALAGMAVFVLANGSGGWSFRKPAEDDNEFI